MRGLAEGDYYFVQSTTKSGYVIEDKKIEFEVEDEDDYIKLTVKNAKESRTCPSEYYYDLNTNAWYHEAIDFVLSEGLMNGTGGRYFSPSVATNRAMIVTILWRLEGQPYVASKLSFKDVASGVWYTEAVRWAASEGIVEGYSETEFGPLDNITREQLATILYRYAQYKGEDVSTSGSLSSYNDAAKVSDWAYAAMRWACGNGIMNGKGNGVLDPQGSALRSEVAQVLMNYLK